MLDQEHPDPSPEGPHFDMSCIHIVLTPLNILELFWRFFFDEMRDIINSMTVCSNLAIINTSTGDPCNMNQYELNLFLPRQGILQNNECEIENLDSEFGSMVHDIIRFDIFKRMFRMFRY